MTDIYDYGDSNDNPNLVTNDMRAQEVREMAEGIFESEVSGLRKLWPTGKKPDPVREIGFPEWQFDVFLEKFDSVNQDEVNRKILMLKEGAATRFFKFAGDTWPMYYPKGRFFRVRLVQE